MKIKLHRYKAMKSGNAQDDHQIKCLTRRFLQHHGSALSDAAQPPTRLSFSRSCHLSSMSSKSSSWKNQMKLVIRDRTSQCKINRMRLKSLNTINSLS